MLKPEEKTAHINEISNKFIPHLTEPGVLDGIRELSIQDNIVVLSHARHALENKIFPMDEEQEKGYNDAIQTVYNHLIYKITNADRLYLVIDRNTRLPYIDDNNNCYVFSEQEFASEALDQFAEQFRSWEMMTLKNGDIIKTLGQTFYEKGAGGIICDNGQIYAGIPAEHLIMPPKTDKEMPLLNPEFVRALAKFVQEEKWHVTYEGREERLRNYEKDMIREFCNAEFFIPVLGRPEEHEAGEKVQVPNLTRNNGTHLLPVFTDWTEFEKVYSRDKYSGWTQTAKDLLAAPDNEIIINPGSIAFEMNKHIIAQTITTI